ncbi:MAG: ribonuclease HII [Dehalococcoidia bacterium]
MVCIEPPEAMMALRPTFDYERPLWKQGLRLVAGVDEVGRGPLAGPVVAAAVILPPGARFPWLADVRDSKLLSAARREELAEKIRAGALAVGIGAVVPERIDALGIAPASRLAMAEALSGLTPPAEYALIDAFMLPEVRVPQSAIIDGDALSFSIAAASIVAKVHRDRIMLLYDALYPEYGFCHHKGYSTAEHLEALVRHGPCPIHRRSFAPVRERLVGRPA